jgi:very-short-patch-repair endonuclease
MTVEELLRAQDGVITPRQVRAAGVSAYRLRRQLGRGEWVPMYGGRVLRRSGAEPSPTVRDRAAVLALGNGAMLAGPSAARWLGMPVAWAEPVLRVPARSRREPTGIRVLRGDVADDDVQIAGDVLVTGRSLTIVDCLLVLPETRGRELLDRALQLGWLQFDELVRRTQLMVGRPGVSRLRRHVRVAAPGARSEAERGLVGLLRRAGIRGWVTQHVVAGIGVLDVAFPDVRLAVEVDGRAWHAAGDRFQRDRVRQNALVAAGWTVLRFTWADVMERPDHVVAVILATLGRARPAS